MGYPLVYVDRSGVFTGTAGVAWHPMAPTKLAASRGGINDPRYDPPNPRYPGTQGGTHDMGM